MPFHFKYLVDRFDGQTTILNFGLGRRTYKNSTLFYCWTAVLNSGLSSPTMVLTFRLGSWATEFSSGFGSQIVVLSFGLGSRSITASSWRSEPSCRGEENRIWWRTDGRDLCIKSPCRRLNQYFYVISLWALLVQLGSATNFKDFSCYVFQEIFQIFTSFQSL